MPCTGIPHFRVSSWKWVVYYFVTYRRMVIHHLLGILLGRATPLPQCSTRGSLHILSLVRIENVGWWLGTWLWCFGTVLVIGKKLRLPRVAFICRKCGNQPSSVQSTPLVVVGCHRGGVLRGRPCWQYSPYPPINYQWGVLAWIQPFWSLWLRWTVYSPFWSPPPSGGLLLTSILEYSSFLTLTLPWVRFAIILVSDLVCILCVQALCVIHWGPRPGYLIHPVWPL